MGVFSAFRRYFFETVKFKRYPIFLKDVSGGDTINGNSSVNKEVLS